MVNKKQNIKDIWIALIIFVIYVGISTGGFLLLLMLDKQLIIYFENNPLFRIIGLGNFLWGFIVAFLSGILLWGIAVFILSFAFRRTIFEHKIYPFPLRLEAGDILKDDATTGYLNRADDEFIIFKYRAGSKFIRNFLAFIGVMSVVIITSNIKDVDLLTMEAGMGCFMFFTLIATVVYYFIRPERQVVFDRMNGTVTLPGALFLLPRKTVDFSAIIPGTSFGVMAFKYSKYMQIGTTVWGRFDIATWSFYVQYMDKNWPLPSGPVFDQYRNKDFQRRKAEGFPLPTYPNEIWLTDESAGYIWGSEQLKRAILSFDINYRQAHDMVRLHIKYNTDITIINDNDIVWIGLYDKSYVFKLFTPLNEEKIILPHSVSLSGCFVVNGFINKRKFDVFDVLKEDLVKYIV